MGGTCCDSHVQRAEHEGNEGKANWEGRVVVLTKNGYTLSFFNLQHRLVCNIMLFTDFV